MILHSLCSLCRSVLCSERSLNLNFVQQGLGIFLFTMSRTALVSTQPPIHWVPGALSLGVHQPGCEADHSPPPSAEVKNAWSYTSTPQYIFMAWCLIKHRDNFTFTYFPLEKPIVTQLVKKFPAFYGI
jgi:hypothetical protein